MTEIEKECETCNFENVEWYEEPCRKCNLHTNDKWEPKND